MENETSSLWASRRHGGAGIASRGLQCRYEHSAILATSLALAIPRQIIPRLPPRPPQDLDPYSSVSEWHSLLAEETRARWCRASRRRERCGRYLGRCIAPSDGVDSDRSAPAHARARK